METEVKKAKKIAICGSAPSSLLLAPFGDPEWEIWGTSPSCWAQLEGRKADVWFELHRWLPYAPAQANAPGVRPWFSPEFKQFLQGQPLVYMTEQQPDIPGCVRYPYDAMIAKHGPYHFCSSVSWMLALAIEQEPEAIGVFGIDMAANSEYAYQRPACQHFLGLAKGLGIDVVLPPESDLMRPTTMYGIGEHNPRHIKIAERLKELEGQEAQATQAMQQGQMALNRIQAAREAYQYMLDTWCDDIDPDPALAQSFSGVFVKSIPHVSLVEKKVVNAG